MKGFNNIGNTCYMNSALHIILNNKYFKHIFNYEYESGLLKIMSELSDVYHDPNGVHNQVKTISPVSLYKHFGQKHGLFNHGRQNDSTEFLLLFMDDIEEEIKQYDDKLIRKIYDTKIRNYVKCKIKDCGNVSQTVSYERFLILDMIDNLNLDSMFENYKSRIKLTDENKWDCDKCKKKTIASKRLEVLHFPKTLFISIKRFQYNMRGQYVKDCRSVDIPLYWKQDYQLTGLILHYGNVDGGHYVSCYKVNNEWFLFNDSHVSTMSEEDVTKVASEAYILVYNR